MIHIVETIQLSAVSAITMAFLSDSLGESFDKYLGASNSRPKMKVPDLRTTIKNLYPDQQIASRFSIKNPHARFSIHPN